MVLAALHVALFGLAKIGLCLLLWAWKQRDHFQTVFQLSWVLAFPTSHPSSQTPSQAPPPPCPMVTSHGPVGKQAPAQELTVEEQEVTPIMGLQEELDRSGVPI